MTKHPPQAFSLALWRCGSIGRSRPGQAGSLSLGSSASGCRPTGQSSSVQVGLWQPQVGSLWGPAKGQWLQGGVLAMAEERVPLHTRMSSGCFIMSTSIHWPEQVTRPSPSSVGKEGATFCLQGKGEGEYLPNYSTGVWDIF